MSHYFSIAFLSLLALTTAVRIWLGLRHIRHVRANRDQVPAMFANRISLAAHQKAADYTCAKSRLNILSSVAEAALLIVLTLGGGIQWMHDLLAPHFHGLVYGIILILGIALISSLVDLPFALMRQFGIEADFGFNRMTPALYVADLAKQLFLMIAIGVPLVALILWLMNSMGPAWWIYAWLFWSAFNLALLFVFPTWIAPLFNKFSPLDDDALRTRIEALLTRCGFRSSGLFIMDGSRRSSHGNAYFTGFGNNKRIVFFDTLLTRLRPEEIEAVLAHELGHFKHHHITQRIALMLLMSLALLWLLGQLMGASWFYMGLGVQAENTALALILFFLAAPVFTFLASPLGALLSRRHEYQADRYARDQASGTALIQALVKLYEDNAATLTPDPLHSLFYDSHPPASLRIAQLSQAVAHQ